MLVAPGGLEIGTLLRRRGLEQGICMHHGDRVAGDHQLHHLHLPRGLHVAQHPGEVRRELLVLQLNDRLRANAFEQVDAPIDRVQIHANGPGQSFLADPAIDCVSGHAVLQKGRESVDAVVLGAGLVVLGDQPGGFVHAEIIQGQHTQ